jgi:trimethylamine--corrinoid protein Co-methyltransferase
MNQFFVVPTLKAASTEQLEVLHQASLHILEKTGVNYLNEEALILLRDAGAHISGWRVRIPQSLVERCLKLSQKSVVFYDRNGQIAMRLEKDNDYFGTGSDTPYIIDPFSGMRRQPVLKDIEQMSRLVDFLPNISFTMCMGIASDVDEKTSDMHHLLAMVKNTTKPIIFTSWYLENLRAIYDMCIAIAGNERVFAKKPFAALYAMPTAPLRHTDEVCKQILFCAQKEIPLVYPSGPLLAATSPVTIAGSLAQLNAEFLSGLVLAQLKRPGAILIHGGATCPLDFRTMTMSIAAPEVALGYVVLKEMAAYYHLPIFTLAGASDSKILDQQAASEAAFSITMACLSGQNLIHDVGYIEGGLTSSFEMVMLGDELIAMARRFKKGFQLNEEKLGLDVIDRRGPGGSFIEDEHTLKFFKEEIWYPSMLDRRNYRSWSDYGGKDLFKILTERVQHIFHIHQPDPLPEDIIQQLQKIIERSEIRHQNMR